MALVIILSAIIAAETVLAAVLIRLLSRSRKSRAAEYHIRKIERDVHSKIAAAREGRLKVVLTALHEIDGPAILDIDSAKAAARTALDWKGGSKEDLKALPQAGDLTLREGKPGA